MPVTCFLPCRKGSERVPNKNTRPFAGSSLIEIKLYQLLQSKLIDTIIVSTDDPLVAESAKRYGIEPHWRDASLCRNDTSTDALIVHVAELIPEGDILWTHVTSPFVDAAMYDDMIATYWDAHCDSLMTVTQMHGFPWPPNWDRNAEKWPRTQTLAPAYEVNSAAFIAQAETYREGDRIGVNPHLYELAQVESIDIDWPADFELAERLM